MNYTRDTTTCGDDYQVRRVGPLATGPIYRGTPANCVLHTPTNFLLYTVGVAVAPSELATGTLVTAP